MNGAEAEMNGMVFLQARGVDLVLGGARILSGVDFSARCGAVTAIMGCNGAGKSSLLRVLCGELSPRVGSVAVGGRPLAGWDNRELARVRAVVPQSSALVFPFTVYEVVLLGRSPHDDPAPVADEIVHQAMERTGLSGMEEREYTTLSGGERQRVHIARAIAQIHAAAPRTPRLLCMDEPTSSLDLAHQHRCLRTARELAADNVCVVVVLHDLNLCHRYADQIFLMHQGACLAGGDTAAVMQPELLGKAYGVPVERTTNRAFFDVRD